jgi:hypothetical protein
MSVPSTSKLELRTAYGPVYRTILNTSPRDCTPAEIPVIDLEPLLSSSLDSRARLAREVAAAAEGSGFFYIKNHGIPDNVIEEAKRQALVYACLRSTYLDTRFQSHKWEEILLIGTPVSSISQQN